MSTPSTLSSNSSIDGRPQNLRLSGLALQSAYTTPLTSCPDSPNVDLDGYFEPKGLPAEVSVEPTYPKVDSVCFVGAGFVGM